MHLHIRVVQYMKHLNAKTMFQVMFSLGFVVKEVKRHSPTNMVYPKIFKCDVAVKSLNFNFKWFDIWPKLRKHKIRYWSEWWRVLGAQWIVPVYSLLPATIIRHQQKLWPKYFLLAATMNFAGNPLTLTGSASKPDFTESTSYGANYHRSAPNWRLQPAVCKKWTFGDFCIKCHIKSISDMSYQKWSLLHVYWMIWGTNRCIYIYCWAILQTYFQSEISFKSQKYPLTDSVGNDVADGVARLHVVHGDRHHPLLLSHCLLTRLWGGLNKTQF